MNPVEFFVPGVPVPQGSSRAFLHKHTGRVIVTSANKQLGDWRSRVSWYARQAYMGGNLIEGPVEVRSVFQLVKPKSSPKKRLLPDRRPDLDKLTRALLDSLTGVFYRDDAQVCRLIVDKIFGAPGIYVKVGMMPIQVENAPFPCPSAEILVGRPGGQG